MKSACLLSRLCPWTLLCAWQPGVLLNSSRIVPPAQRLGDFLSLRVGARVYRAPQGQPHGPSRDLSDLTSLDPASLPSPQLHRPPRWSSDLVGSAYSPFPMSGTFFPTVQVVLSPVLLLSLEGCLLGGSPIYVVSAIPALPVSHPFSLTSEL